MVTKFADGTDKALFGVGIVASIITGLGLPSFVFLFGDIINTFGDPQHPDKMIKAINTIALEMTIIGLIIWFFSYFYFAFLVILSERIGQKTKVAYLRAILRQDITWFDNINPSELSSNLFKEVQAMQRAIGEKTGTLILSVCMSISGLFFAFFKGWLFSFILLAVFPLIFMSSFFLTKIIQSGYSESLKAYAQSSGYAE